MGVPNAMLRVIDRSHERPWRSTVQKMERRGPWEGCWEWPSTGPSQYGKVVVDRRKQLVHRLVYEAIYGEAPAVVRHRCDNPACFRPSHLEAGTQTDNMRDMKKRGRHRPVPSKLTAEQWAEVQRRRDAGETTRRLGAAFGVSCASVCRHTTGAS